MIQDLLFLVRFGDLLIKLLNLFNKSSVIILVLFEVGLHFVGFVSFLLDEMKQVLNAEWMTDYVSVMFLSILLGRVLKA